MADTDLQTSYYTVQTGGSESVNSLNEISAEKSIDVNILKRLNPNIKSPTQAIAAGTQVLIGVGEMTKKLEYFNVETFYVYASNIITLASISKDQGIDVNDLLELNKGLGVSQNVHLSQGTMVLLKVLATSDGTMVEIEAPGIRKQVNTSRTFYVRWAWNTELNKTQNYQVIWEWQSSDNEWWEGSNSTTSDADTKLSTYTADEQAIAIRVKVKPNAQSGFLTGKTTYGWSTHSLELGTIYTFGYLAATTPSKPSVELSKYKLTATLDDVAPVDPDEQNNPVYPQIQFEIVKDHTYVDGYVYLSDPITVNTGHVTFSYTSIVAGSNYKVRCRSLYNGIFSAWSDYDGPHNALPIAPTLTDIIVQSKTAILLKWTPVHSAKSYNIQYCVRDPELYPDLTDEEYIKLASPSPESIDANEFFKTSEDGRTEWIEYPMDGLATGGKYCIRISSNNGTDDSDWSPTRTFILGTTPDSPTTWSSTTTAEVGESLVLYWIHNSQDGSIETSAQIKLNVDGNITYVRVPELGNKPKNEDGEYETSNYPINTESYNDGATITWQVRTAGVLEEQYGDWSEERVVKIYAPPALQLALKDKEGAQITEITSFPFNIDLTVGNTANQTPIGYYVYIESESDYTTTDNIGNTKSVSKGTRVYSQHFDASNSDYDYVKMEGNNYNIEIRPNHVTLENNKYYTIKAIVSMSSGLRGEAAITRIPVGWIATQVAPLADISINKNTLSAYIYPYVNTEEDILLSVYRREYDGTFTEIDRDIPNNRYTVALDPHPALDYARYRIVAKNQTTGAISYNDVPGYRVGEPGIVIQWDEKWNSFDALSDGTLPAEPTWSGMMLKLPYNVDVSSNHSPEVSLVKYIGRTRPVSYYGTHRGELSSWSTVIPKSDTETLYLIRKLAIWMGNVYVRESSGMGYWANITVSYNRNHLQLGVPVSFSITPVEGGK